MTSLLLSGYLALSNGRRISSENPNTHKTTQHMYYDTILQTSGVDVPAEIRLWVPATEQPLPDNTVADVFAKMFCPPNEKVLLDIIHILPFPGDPTDAKYEDNIPERPHPTVSVIGHTVGAAETMDDGISLGYAVQASDYVRDQNRTSRVYCRFDGNKARWKKTPWPSPGAAIFIIGLAYGIHLATGNIIVDVDQLQLNVGTSATVAHASPARNEAGGPPAKRRRFPATSASSTGTAAASGSKSEAPKSTRKENPFAEGTTADQIQGESAMDEVLSPTDSTASAKKKATNGRRKAASRRDENEEEE